MLISTYLSRITPKTRTGQSDASSTLSVLRRPLRRGAGILQEGARRQGRHADALQGCAGPVDDLAGQPRQGHARRRARRRLPVADVRRPLPRQAEFSRVRADHHRPRRRRRRAPLQRAGRRRPGADAACGNVLRLPLRHGRRQVRRRLDDPGRKEVSAANRQEVSAMVSTATKSADFVISRVFDAPRELVWKAFTDPEHMKEWFGPTGSVVVASKMDFRVGGTYLGAMRDPAGNVMWAKFVYREIVAPERLVWEHSFSDENGGLTRHPFSPTWPLKLLTTVTFDEPLKGQTGLTLRWSPLDATAEEQKTFDAAQDGIRGGWGGTFERLTAYLAETK